MHRFDRCDPAGYNPLSSLIEASDGYLYGTTSRGGEGNECVDTHDTRAGAVYRLDPATFAVTPIHTFALLADGHRPTTALAQGPDGALYGTTNIGGIVSQSYPLGRGTVFRVTRGGAFSVLRRFDGCDGHVPDAPLALGADGRLYGTTSSRRCAAGNGGGTIYRISTTGRFRLLHIFRSSDGGAPRGRLVQAEDGNFYGVTQLGGGYQDGVVYRMSPAGEVVVLHEFGFDGGYGTTGMEPLDGLTIAPDGSFYGTARMAGVPPGDPDRDGVISKMSRTGSRADAVHTFFQNGSEGFGPRTGLVVARDGRLYGTTIVGGQHARGTIFRFRPKAVATLKSVDVFPGEVWSGEPGFDTADAWVILDALAPAGGATVHLATNRPDLITLPASVKVPAGWAVRRFQVTAPRTDQDATVAISATYEGVRKTTTIEVYAAP